MITRIKNLLNNSLHGNSIYLMTAQGVMTVFGYVFWIFAARLYSSQNVGLASALISVATLIANVSILGLNNALVRFLPSSKQKNDKINTSIWLAVIAAFVVSIGYVALLQIFSPKLLFIRHNLVFLGIFLASMVFVTINTLTDSVFLANRATKYNVIIYTAFSSTRLFLPVLLAGLGVLGLFLSHMIGIFIAVVLSFYYMIRKLKYRPAFTLNRAIMKQIGGYSLANYIAGFLWSMPLLIAPVLIVNKLGASAAAYFYMVMMIVNVLIIIPTAASQSLFAEGSHKDGAELIPLARKSTLFSLKFVILGVIGVLLFGKLAISIFGKEYAAGGASVLYMLAASCLLVVFTMTGNTILKIQKKVWSLAIINVLGAAITLSCFMLFIRHGLISIGIGYAIGQVSMLTMYGIVFSREWLKQKRAHIMLAPASAE